MTIRSYRVTPKNTREQERFYNATTVTPSDGSVSPDQLATTTITLINTTANTAASSASTSAVAAHVAAADPHPQYTSDAESAALAATAVATHVALPDPHSQYALDTDVTALQATGTYTGGFTGTTTDPAPTIRYSKVGKVVALYVPLTNATSNSTGFTITGAPAAIQPTRAQTMLAIVRDNGTVQIGTASMGNTGTLTLGNGATSGVFTNSGTKGVELMTLTYSLD